MFLKRPRLGEPKSDEMLPFGREGEKNNARHRIGRKPCLQHLSETQNAAHGHASAAVMLRFAPLGRRGRTNAWVASWRARPYRGRAFYLI